MGFLCLCAVASANANATTSCSSSGLHSAPPLNSNVDERSTFCQSASENNLFVEIENALARHEVSESQFQNLAIYVQNHPRDALALFLLGGCFELRGLEEMAEEQFKKSEQAWSDPKLARRLFIRHIIRDDLRRAVIMLPFMQKHFPDDPLTKLVDAIFAEETGQDLRAGILYKELMVLSPAPPGVATRIASIKVAEENYVLAIRLANQDLQQVPQYLPAILVKSSALVKLGRYHQAMEALKPALKAHPFSRRLSLVAYDACLGMGDQQHARYYAVLNLALSDTSTNIEAARQRVFNSLSCATPVESQTTVNDVSKTIDDSPYATKMYYHLGEIFNLMHRPAAAAHQFVKSYSIDRKFAPTLTWLGRLTQHYERNYHEAAVFYKQAGDEAPLYFENSSIRFRLRDRLLNRRRDVAWRMQDCFFKCVYGDRGLIPVSKMINR